jgi:hypothetical protein
MRNKIVLWAAVLATAACAQPGRETAPVRMGNESTDSRASVKAQDSRAAAAGGSGSHAPGSPRYQASPRYQ